MSTIDVLIKEESACKHLGITKKALNRKIGAGYLRAIKRRGKNFFVKGEIDSYLKKNELIRNHGEFIKFLYACEKMAVKDLESEVGKPTDDDWDLYWSTVGLYSKNRNQALKSFYFNGFCPNMLLMVGEAKARLNLKDPKVIYRLVFDEEIRDYVAESENKKKTMVTIGSLDYMLGEYADRVLYRSDEVSEMIGLSVNNIVKLARQREIGLKLGSYKNSSYVFSLDDIRSIKDCRRKY